MKFTGERIIPDEKECSIRTDTYQEHSARYEFATKFVKGDKILDAACGVGYGTKILSEVGGLEVHGCDFSEDAIAYAKKRYSNKSVQFHVMDISRLDFPDNSFHSVVSFETIEHVKNYKQAIDEFARVLKEDGVLIISTPNKEVDNTENPFHYKEFSKDEFLELLKTHFSDFKLYSQRLVIKPSRTERFTKNILKLMVLGAKIDFLKLRKKIFREGMYQKSYSSIDTTIEYPDVIPYQNSHNPRNFVVVCQKQKF